MHTYVHIYMQVQLIITSATNWIKSCNYVILAIIGSVVLASLAYGLVTLKIENKSLQDKVKNLAKEADQLHAEHDIWSAQIIYIQKWMEPITELEYHMYTIIHYRKLQKRQSEFYSFSEEEREQMAELRKFIGYDVDASHVDEIVVKAIDLIAKFKIECQKFLDALLYRDVEEMKNLQAQTNMEKIKEKMEDFAKEVIGLHSNRSPTTAMQQEGILAKVVSGIHYFGAWFIRWIGRLFLS